MRRTILALTGALILLVLTAIGTGPATADPTPNSRVGIGVHWNFGTQAELDTAGSKVRASGVGWVRIDARWNEIQAGGAGSWNWTLTDKVVGEARSHGLQVLLLPSYAPAWANGGSSNAAAYPTGNGPWATFVDAVVRRYLPQGVTAYEIWNEPNLAPNPSVANFVSKVLIPGANAARAASTSLGTPITVLNAAPASVLNHATIPNPYTWVAGVYANGGGGYFDAQATHPYCQPLDPTTDDPTWNHLKRSTEIHDIMAANGDGGKQIWATEFGYPTAGNASVHENLQAEYIDKALGVWTGSGWSWAGPIFLYVYMDSGIAPTTDEASFGLVHDDATQSPKPAMQQLPTMLSDVPGLTGRDYSGG